MGRVVPRLVLGVGLMIAQAACGGRAANPDASGGSVGGSGGAAAGTGGDASMAGGSASGGAGAGGQSGGRGGASGGGGTGGAVLYECYKEGGSCSASCPTSCPHGSHVTNLACPFSESNAICSPNLCCLPDAPTDGGAGGTAASTYACGSGTCTTGETLCYSFLPGVPGGGQTRGCMPLPAACANEPTCACVCPPTSPPGIGCNFPGGLGSCSCSDVNGLTVTCAGV